MKEDVLKFMLDHEPISSADLAHGLGCSVGSARAILANLTRSGQVIRDRATRLYTLDSTTRTVLKLGQIHLLRVKVRKGQFQELEMEALQRGITVNDILRELIVAHLMST